MYKNQFISVIITAAGSGNRMNSNIPKLEIKIHNKPIINYTVEKLANVDIFDEIILVTSKELLEEYKSRFKIFKNLEVVLGGDSREESTFKGLKALSVKSEIVLCHDGARPFVKEETILDSIDSAILNGSGVACVKTKDTIKLVSKNKVELTPNREKLYLVQTPQTFKTTLILKAYNTLFNKVKTTDDSSFIEELGEEVYIIKGSYENIKITTKEDLLFAKMLLEEKWELELDMTFIS